MTSLSYKKMTLENDADISQLLEIYNFPIISQFISIGDNYSHYVTSSENVYFYKVYESEKLIGAIHLEKNEHLLYMDILIFPKFQRMGFGTKVLKDILNDTFRLGYDRIEVSIDNSNLASVKLFENAGFSFVSQDDELLNYVYIRD